MILLGQACLLIAFVATSYSAAVGLFAACRNHDRLRWTSVASGLIGMLALTMVVITLAWALVCKDYRFNYVAQYTSRDLPWHYSISALWVGQSGSLLLWTWMLSLLTLAFRVGSKRTDDSLGLLAFGILMIFCSCLTATMVFAADPMQANLAPAADGDGLSPLLQHPAMLIHPPIIFLAYATCAVPCALGLAAMISVLLTKKSQVSERQLSSDWLRRARSWTLAGWTILGSGILLGAYWSYEELGWGGYWAWDPVENGSLIPWLICTALIHAMMVWQYCGMLKKTTISLAIATFCMCNFATFLTRSGIFSSLHAFSQSPIGWLFLGFMLMLGIGGFVLIMRCRGYLAASGRITSIWTRESFIVISMLALLLMAAVTLIGTLSVALSDAIVGRRILVGPTFYNYAMVPIGMVLLVTMSAAPCLRWGSPPQARARRAMLVCASIATIPVILLWFSGVRSVLGLTVAWLVGCALLTHVGPMLTAAWRQRVGGDRGRAGIPISANRGLYASFTIHLGFACIVLGITGSSLGSQRMDVVIGQGASLTWADRRIQFRRLIERDLGDKQIVEAELAVSRGSQPALHLLPAQHYHRRQDQWTTEVAIDSTWHSDFYTILHHGEADGAIRLTLIENPLMRFIWLGGWLIAGATFVRLWPARPMRRGQMMAPTSDSKITTLNDTPRTSVGDLPQRTAA